MLFHLNSSLRLAAARGGRNGFSFRLLMNRGKTVLVYSGLSSVYLHNPRPVSALNENYLNCAMRLWRSAWCYGVCSLRIQVDRWRVKRSTAAKGITTAGRVA